MKRKESSLWLYNGKPLKKPPSGFFGFIYLITNLSDGRIYVGKKQFTNKRKTRLSKKARKATGKRVKIEQVDSQWINYWSSSLELQDDVKKSGEANFSREVIHLCKNKSEMSYYEGQYQYKYNVLFAPSYNKWIYIRVRKANLI